MLKIETGAVYRVKHRDKGIFFICVQFTDKTFTTGMIIKGKVTGFESKNDISSGGQVTVRNSFCNFKRIYILKGDATCEDYADAPHYCDTCDSEE